MISRRLSRRHALRRNVASCPTRLMLHQSSSQWKTAFRRWTPEIPSSRSNSSWRGNQSCGENSQPQAHQPSPEFCSITSCPGAGEAGRVGLAGSGCSRGSAELGAAVLAAAVWAWGKSGRRGTEVCRSSHAGLRLPNVVSAISSLGGSSCSRCCRNLAVLSAAR